MIKAQLIDGHGSGSKLKINGEGELHAVIHPHPPFDEVSFSKPFLQNFTTTGSPGGTSDMKVNGSVTPVEYSILAHNDIDVYIKTISVVIADANCTLNKFGNITALTNGCCFEHETLDTGITIIHGSLKTNFDFVRLAQGYPSFGDNTTAFKAGNVAGASEAYMPVINMSLIFGLQWGLRLRRGTNDKLVFRINDDTTGVDLFDAIGYGFLV